MKIKIFLFHRVSPTPNLLWDPLSPEKFEYIIKYITKKYAVVQLENYILNSFNDNKTQKQLAAIVFDDGYKDFIQYALPILKKHSCPSSMYVVTDCITNQFPTWTYILDEHFIRSKKLALQLDEDKLPEDLRIPAFKDLNSRFEFAKKFKSYLKTIDNIQRTQLYQQVIKSLDDVEISSDLMLNWDELKQLKNEGVEIGSHSISHPLLAKIKNESEIINEIKGSGEVIKKQLGHFPIVFSYPIGSYNQRIKEITKESGYKLGLAVNQEFFDSNNNDLFEIPRVELYNSNFIKTRLRISGILPKINKWIKR